MVFVEMGSVVILRAVNSSLLGYALHATEISDADLAIITDWGYNTFGTRFKAAMRVFYFETDSDRILFLLKWDNCKI